MIVRVSTAEGGSATGAEGWDTLMTYWTVKLGHSRRGKMTYQRIAFKFNQKSRNFVISHFFLF